MSDANLQAETTEDKLKQQEEIEKQRLASLTEEDKAVEQAFKDTFAFSLQEANLTSAQMQDTDRLFMEAKTRIATFKASHTAEGSPVQQYASPKRGFKKRREDKRLLKEYQEKNKWNGADLFTMETDMALQERAKEKANAESVWLKDPELAERVQTSGADNRVLQIFCQGFKVNESGEPLDETEAAKKAANLTFVEDYISGDIEKKRPHLDKMTEKFLDAKLDVGMLTDDYVHDHILELKDLTNELCYYDNVMKDPTNAAYFSEMPAFKRRLIEVRFGAVAAFNNAVTQICFEHGIGFDSNGLMLNVAKSIKAVRGGSQFAINEFQRDFKKTQIKEESLIVDVNFRRFLKQQVSSAGGYNGSSGAGDPAKMAAYKKAFQEIPLKAGEQKPADLEKEKTGPNGIEVEKGSAIALSNEAYRKAKKDNKTGDDLTKAAISALGIRVSSTAMQKSDEAMHGTIFDGYKAKYKELYDAVSDNMEIPAETMSHTYVTKHVNNNSPSTRPFGAGVEALSRALLETFKGAVITDTSGFNEYITEAYNNIGQAEVFQSDKKAFARYIMNNLWLKYSAQARNASILPRKVEDPATGGYVKDARQEAIAKMFTEADRLVLYIYNAEKEMTPQDIENLPADQAEFKQLYKEYEAMIDLVAQKIRSASDAAGGSAPGAAQ